MATFFGVGKFANDITFSDALLSPGSGAGSFKAGISAVATGANSVAVGPSTFSNALQSYTYGTNAQVHSPGGISIGLNPFINSGSDNSIALGTNTFVNTGHPNAIVAGTGAASTAASRFTVGTIGGANDMELQIGRGFAAWGGTPPTTQPAKIATPIDLATALTAISRILNVIEGAGLTIDAFEVSDSDSISTTDSVARTLL